MKKWYLITAILALLLLISFGTCSINSAEVDRLEEELANARATEDDLVDVTGELEDARFELALLKATKEIDFGNGLRIFDISPGSSGVGGNVQNVNSVPMEELCILIAFYEEDGSFLDIGLTYERNLFPQEVADWWVWCSDYWPSGFFDVYAIGNRKD